jgi:hypothetical protein
VATRWPPAERPPGGARMRPDRGLIALTPRPPVGILALVADTIASQAPRVDLPDGPITLEPLDKLVAKVNDLNQAAIELLRASDAPIGQAKEKLEAAGKVLIQHKGEWDATVVADQVAQIGQLQVQVGDLNQQIAVMAAKPHSGLGGLWHSITDGHHQHELEVRRANLSQQLDQLLVTFAEHAPERTVPEADALRVEARQFMTEAKSRIDLQHATSEELKVLVAEVQRRQAAMKEMGFDSLYTAGWLQAHGPEPIQSPLALKPKEQAWVSVPAVLARQSTRTRFVGGSQGMSFPIGHTGIRYRVGSFHGHPVQTTSISDIDEGTLVLSSLRIAFIGRLKSVVTPLVKVIHVEAYSDALAVFQEGRENPNFYKLTAPQYFLLYLNWALDQQG